jgi:hypothetical protein
MNLLLPDTVSCLLRMVHLTTYLSDLLVEVPR